MADLVGEFAIRIFGEIVLELFLFRVCRFVGWTVLKILTLGVYPTGMLREQKEHGWVSYSGLFIIVGAVILLILYFR